MNSKEEIVLDLRELIPKKVIYETGAYYDRLKPGQILKVISAGDLRWLQKTLKMKRTGQFKVTLEFDEKEKVHIGFIERA